MFNFNQQVILITGAAGNLGQAVTRAFRAGGAKLVLVDRTPDRLGHIYPDLVTAPNIFLAAPYDIFEPESVKALVGRIVDRFGRLDILVNTVGGYRAGTPVHQTPLETFDLMININARSAFIISQAVVPVMINQGSGKIIHVAAKAGMLGAANGSAYSAAKSAVIRLTESLSAELKDKGINVNCLIPGTIDTPQNREAMPTADTSHWVTAEAVADVVLFLASTAARAVNGAVIPVTGKG
jgi:NAD(P)-dependent dehydrogenase (short-subunit alcohol dehydrogenase family)